LTGIYSVLIKN